MANKENKQIVKKAVKTFKDQINTALDGNNQSKDIQAAVNEMLNTLNIQRP
ncbi:hypothetical protein [Metabacillus sp. FJAT-53654]|uniref:Uncharacterized protein n=1 Tax=Metabacillus rhizosphaerae TaxID=3117747 RepID=A0ABZ2MM89_9BACI